LRCRRHRRRRFCLRLRSPSRALLFQLSWSWSSLPLSFLADLLLVCSSTATCIKTASFDDIGSMASVRSRLPAFQDFPNSLRSPFGLPRRVCLCVRLLPTLASHRRLEAQPAVNGWRVLSNARVGVGGGWSVVTVLGGARQTGRREGEWRRQFQGERPLGLPSLCHTPTTRRMCFRFLNVSWLGRSKCTRQRGAAVQVASPTRRRDAAMKSLRSRSECVSRWERASE
jgi:hypothetical protein